MSRRNVPGADFYRELYSDRIANAYSIGFDVLLTERSRQNMRRFMNGFPVTADVTFGEFVKYFIEIDRMDVLVRMTLFGSWQGKWRLNHSALTFAEFFNRDSFQNEKYGHWVDFVIHLTPDSHYQLHTVSRFRGSSLRYY